MTVNERPQPAASPRTAAQASRQQPQAEIIDRKQAEEDLLENEWRLRHATESAGLTYFEVDLVRGGARTAANFAAVMGYAPPREQEKDVSASTRLLLAHVVPQDRARVAAAIEEFLAGTCAGKLDYRVLGDDQVERWIETRWSFELAVDGTPLNAFATHLDITERKRAGREIRESEERYRNLFDSIDEGFCVIEMICDERGKAVDWRYLEVNPSFEKQTGMKAVVGKRVRELLPEIEANWFEVYGNVALTGEPVRLVKEVKPLDKWIDLYAFRVDEPDKRKVDMGGRWFDVYACRVGEPASRKVALVFNDITARKQVEETLRAGEQRLRFVMDSMPQKIATSLADGGVDYFNPQWSEFTGLPLEQISDVGWKQFLHPDDLAETMRLWQQAIATGEVVLIEHRFRRADGEYRWHLSRTVPMRDAAGKVALWIGSSTDIHEVKEADYRKDEFLAMLAHELRNPLAPILNMMEVMKRADDNRPWMQPVLSMMERQLKHMTRLIDDLLDASRISQGKIRLRREKVELTSVVRQVVEASRPSYEAAQQELTVELPPPPVYVDADPVRLTQVFGNLLHNASKFSSRGGTVALTAELLGDDVVIGVRDLGIGIEAALLPRVFELFTQGDQKLERTHGGLGIGLTLVRRLVEMHGGSVQAASEGVDRGSEFVVRLPVQIEKHEVPAPDPTASGPIVPLGRRILVVDDNHDAAEALAMLLEMSGHQTQLAFNGVEAVEAAKSFLPDVILMDLGMPILNGFEAARQVRTQPWSKSMVLVALTGWGQDEDRTKTAEAGFDSHLVKPVEFDAITRLLDGLGVVATEAPVVSLASDR